MQQVEPPLFLNSLANTFNEYLSSFLEMYLDNDSPLTDPLKYALLGEGKRVRPILVYLTSEILGGNQSHASLCGLALEFVHTYSLIHDDLPCMDDDSIRRGRPTLHVRFNEATALLVGDALLTDSFGILGGKFDSFLQEHCQDLSGNTRLKMVNELSFASGSFGMAKGQSLDLFWENRTGGTVNDLEKIHFHKTGCLFKASCILGALSATEDPSIIKAMKNIGQKIGLIFQIADDILDCYDNTGKSKGKDLEANKLTYVSILGEAEAMAKVEELTDSTIKDLRSIGKNTQNFEDFVYFLGNRFK